MHWNFMITLQAMHFDPSVFEARVCDLAWQGPRSARYVVVRLAKGISREQGVSICIYMNSAQHRLNDGCVALFADLVK